VSLRPQLEGGADQQGREHLVLTQGAWTCQRGVRFGRHLYLKTTHDGFHADWPDEMLFDVVSDPHEQADLAPSEGTILGQGREILTEWTGVQLDRALDPKRDPLEIVVDEGGPFHVRGRLPEYIRRLEDTGRSRWVEPLLVRHGVT
jgi:choline-sulfatase